MTTPPDPTAPLEVAEIRAFAAEWYRLLDVHAPAEDLLAMVAEDGLTYYRSEGIDPYSSTEMLQLITAPPLEFVLPEGTLSGVGAFRQWYEGVIRIFFDELHVIDGVDATFTWKGREALAKVRVNWQARRWSPPAPRSQWIGFDADQDWLMVRSATTAQPVILRYVVNALNPMPGSPPL